MITKIKTCTYCDGDGYTYEESYPDSPSNTYHPCKVCGGKGWNNDNLNRIEKGSGKIEYTYQEIICSECHGDKRVRYMKSKYNSPQYTLFGDVSYEEQKAWEKEYTEIKNCQKCKGTGKELKEISSKPYKGGCFITTACVNYYNLKDNCYELEILRSFRDNYVENIPNGHNYIKEYYQMSPKIIQYIQIHPEKDKIFKLILSSIKKSIFYIENRCYDNAFKEYEHMYHTLLNLTQNTTLEALEVD